MIGVTEPTDNGRYSHFVVRIRVTLASPRRINPICLLIRARNVERSFDQIFFSPPLSGYYYYYLSTTPFIFHFRTEKESNEEIRKKKRKGDEGMDPFGSELAFVVSLLTTISK